ncbi:hypothetical protein Pmar_PMAR016300 [Perkinsus marinus ATCC 50983]|uniref:Uncharacterized protein n=1 Tax=Perkinsus marinus (strain ATCC 50983 / TXsc) TaxID=423536 RepID=C5KJ50_PERM5|nr:hypothetical protein Pmar_PMAR016300 [Perkinsus marinus ATCC 50983]EER15493.1 hypothetical protein Pmar_PMAR016300 [Perkinsus marinus ATCC 50983]|eukprot:XP_002783697.1 hypothetical protein Pmar_PMAR016300 [Perkinsus marinus ATCC 50983]
MLLPPQVDFIKSAVSATRDPVAAALVYHALSALDLAMEVDSGDMPGLDRLVEAKNITPIALSGAMEYFVRMHLGSGRPWLESMRKGFIAAHPTSPLMTAVAVYLPHLIDKGDLELVRALQALVMRAKPGFAKSPPTPKTIVTEVQHCVSRVRYGQGGPAAATDCRRVWITREAGMELYTDGVASVTMG